MYPLFETICVANGKIQNRHYHELRFMESYRAFYGKKPTYILFDHLNLPELNPLIKYKLKIRYNETGTDCIFTEYHNIIPTSLQSIYDDTAAYALKYTDRNHLEYLYEKKAELEDVLIIKNGAVTDASYSNILFTNGEEIITPKTPLLKGTCRARLLDENKIKEDLILSTEIHQFHYFQLINAMNDFSNNRWVNTKNISFER